MKNFPSIVRLFIISFCIVNCSAVLADDPVRVGWLGPMTGSIAKYGAYQAATIAEEDINREGGINGRPFKLIFEDGKGSGASAVSAVQKLLAVDKVQFIVGGHCTPESLPISSIVQQSGAVMLAAITSSPKLTSAGDNIFRITAVSTTGVDLLTKYIFSKSKAGTFGVVYEETDYALPLAMQFKNNLEAARGKIALYEGYLPGESDFRSLLTKIKSSHLDGLYLAVQSPDTAILIMQQMQQLGVSIPVFGNEIAGNALHAYKGDSKLFEGLTFPEPEFDPDNLQVKHLRASFKEKFNLDDLPFGFWTAEAYDAVRVMADAIKRCGNDVQAVKKCFYSIKNYQGASGSITIDSNGDGIRNYSVKKVQSGSIIKLLSSEPS